MNRLAVFDCDGTLIDSAAVICRAMSLCFAEEGLTPPEDAAIRRIVGLSLPQAMAALLPDLSAARHEALAVGYKRAFHGLRAGGHVEEPLYAGIRLAVERIAAAGWLLGVATGKSDRGLAIVLEAHGLSNRFVTLQTADRHPSKPNPAMLHAAIAEAGASPETTVMIGDTSYDMAMARAAGTRALGVGWGYHPPEELFAAGAHAVALDPADLFGMMTERS